MLSFPLHRAFVALPLDGEAKESFRVIQERLAPFAELLRLQNSEEPHLTLHFWETLMEIEYVQRSLPG